MRFAIYFAPLPGTALHRQGSLWLGRDAATGETMAQPGVAGLHALTSDPRRYGFHATLKPPFALRAGVEVESLMRAAAALAAGLSPFEVKLRLDQLDGFLALVPEFPSPQLDALAERCVRDLDGFRAPPSEAELARRRKAPLSARQDAHLLRWGYPYVFEDFRFHMTLTERLGAEDATRIRAAAEAHFADALSAPISIDGITLFEEPAPAAPFLALRHFPFTLSTSEAAA